MSQNNTFDFMKRYNKNEDTLYCRKCAPDFVWQDEYKLNPDDLPPFVITDCYL